MTKKELQLEIKRLTEEIEILKEEITRCDIIRAAAMDKVVELDEKLGMYESGIEIIGKIHSKFELDFEDTFHEEWIGLPIICNIRLKDKGETK